MATTYPVYHVSFQDDHVGLFIQTDADGEGILHHVRGAVETSGMHFEKWVNTDVAKYGTYVSRNLKGRVRKESVDKIEEICRSVEPPRKQFGPQGPLVPGAPIRRCGDWMAEVWEEIEKQHALDG